MNCYFVWCILFYKKSVNVAFSVVLIEQIVIGLSYWRLGSIYSDWLQNQGKNLFAPLDKDVYNFVRLLAYINDDIIIHELNEAGIFQFLENCILKILSCVFQCVT